MVVQIFQIALCLRDHHAFWGRLVVILNVFNDLTLKQTLKSENLFLKQKEKKLVGIRLMKAQNFHTKLPCQKSMYF